MANVKNFSKSIIRVKINNSKSKTKKEVPTKILAYEIISNVRTSLISRRRGNKLNDRITEGVSLHP